MAHKTEQSDQAPNDEKPEICYCSALPKGSGPCLPCYTRWLAGSAKTRFRPTISNIAARRFHVRKRVAPSVAFFNARQISDWDLLL
jgi:hypothetical protein